MQKAIVDSVRDSTIRVCITTYQPDTKSNPNSNPNPNSTTKQQGC